MKYLLRSFLFLLTFAVFPFLHAQDTTYVRQIIQKLSAPKMHGRWIAHNGDSIAADFIRQEFIDNGIQPIGTDYYQRFETIGYAMEQNPIVKIDGKELKLYQDYNFPFSVQNTKGKFPIIIGDLELFDYDKDDYHCKEKRWKKFRKKHSKQLSEAYIWFDMSQLSKMDTKKQKRIQANINALQWQEKNRYAFKGIIIGVENLPTFGVSYMGKPNFALLYVKSSVLDRKSSSIEVNLPNQVCKHETQNVCGIVRGIAVPDSFLVFTAHYDHLGALGDYYFPGAHDNASGTALVLDLARHFKQNPHRYSTVFLLFTGEEAGLLGSSIFANNAKIPLKKVVQLINFDLSCGGDDGIMLVNGRDSLNLPFTSQLEQLNSKNQRIKEIRYRNNAPNSDHYPFTEQNVPAFFVYTLGGFAAQVHHGTDNCTACKLEHYPEIFKLFWESSRNFMKKR